MRLVTSHHHPLYEMAKPPRGLRIGHRYLMTLLFGFPLGTPQPNRPRRDDGRSRSGSQASAEGACFEARTGTDAIEIAVL
jgi:hypothetical protein